MWLRCANFSYLLFAQQTQHSFIGCFVPSGSHRVEPVGGSRCDSSFALQDLNQWHKSKDKDSWTLNWRKSSNQLSTVKRFCILKSGWVLLFLYCMFMLYFMGTVPFSDWKKTPNIVKRVYVGTQRLTHRNNSNRKHCCKLFCSWVLNKHK